MTTLANHLESTGQTQAAFAKRTETTQATISRICTGHVPSRSLMEKIIAETSGAVTPNDLYGMRA